MQRVNPRIAAAITAMVLGIPVLGIAHTRHEHSETEAKGRVDLIAHQTALRLQDYLKTRLLSLSFIQQGMESGLVDTEEDFQKQSKAVRKELSGIQALNWVSADFQISWVSPLLGNEAALGKSVLENPIGAKAIQRAATTSQACMSAPLHLFQGGPGFTTYFPVSRLEQGELTARGFITGVFRSQEMLAEALGSDLSNRFKVEIHDSGNQVYASDPPQESGVVGAGSKAALIKILDREWELVIYPTPMTLEVMGQFHALPFAFGGLGFVLVFSACVYFFLARREEHQNLLEQKRLVKERMAQAHKLEAVGQLAGGVAHDFNNLLTAIAGSASLAGLDTQPASASARHLDRILQVCKRASEMTSRLLAFSRTQQMDRGQCAAGPELNALHGLLKPLVRSDIRFSFEVADDLHSLPLAPSEFGQVVLNLVTNSMDAMPKGGWLHVKADSALEDADGRAGMWLHLCVSDNGEGMDAAVRDRALEPFFTTKGPGEGTGLGLATVFGIVHGAEGSIHVESEPEAGTKVHVYLPMEPGSEPVSELAEPKSILADDARRECHVLVVDDEEAVREVSVAILESVGHEVLTARNGKEALEIIEQKGKVELVFTDTFMPEVGGLELARKLRQDGFTGGIIITTGHANELSMEDVRELQASYLAKPFSRTELLSLVEYCLAKGDSI